MQKEGVKMNEQISDQDYNKLMKRLNRENRQFNQEPGEVVARYAFGKEMEVRDV